MKKKFVFTALLLAFCAGHVFAAAAGSLRVVNGDFSDTAGLAPGQNGWLRGGAPRLERLGERLCRAHRQGSHDAGPATPRRSAFCARKSGFSKKPPISR